MKTWSLLSIFFAGISNSEAVGWIVSALSFFEIANGKVDSSKNLELSQEFEALQKFLG